MLLEYSISPEFNVKIFLSSFPVNQIVYWCFRLHLLQTVIYNIKYNIWSIHQRQAGRKWTINGLRKLLRKCKQTTTYMLVLTEGALCCNATDRIVMSSFKPFKFDWGTNMFELSFNLNCKNKQNKYDESKSLHHYHYSLLSESILIL